MLCSPPIENCCLKLSIHVQLEKQFVPKFSFWVSVIELHNIIGSPPEQGGLKKVRYEENNIIISGSTLRNILPPQLKNSTA